MSKDAYYFRHDANASDDPKIRVMESKYSAEGYGWYWKILEMMRSEDGYKIMDKPFNWSSLAVKCHSSVDRIKEFVDDCAKEYELFTFDDLDGVRFFYSASFLARMSKLDNMRRQKSEAGKHSWDDR